MKKIIILLIISSSFSYGQINFKDNISRNRQVEICLEIKEKMDLQRSGFKKENSYEEIFDRILSVIGIKRNFQLVECNNINNAVAYTRHEVGKGYVRYIAYDDNFMKKIERNSNDWAKIGILAHEIGHHLNFHNLTYVENLADKRAQEIESDEFAGFVLQKLGATMQDAQLFIVVSNNELDDTNSTHPKKGKRLKAIERGYKNAEKGRFSDKRTEIIVLDKDKTKEDTPNVKDGNFGSVCFLNSNFYSRKLILTNKNSGIEQVILIGNANYRETVKSCALDIPTGIYDCKVYTTFTKKLIEQFNLNIVSGKERSIALSKNHFN